MKKIIHGVLNDESILTVDGRRGSAILISKFNSISDICDYARQVNISLVYILSGTKLFNKICENHETFFQDNARWNFSPKEIKHIITCWQAGAKVQIILAGNYKSENPRHLAHKNLQTKFELYKITDQKRFFDAVKWFYEKTGVYPSNPQRTGKTLAKTSANENIEALTESADNYKANLSKDLIWFDKTKTVGKKYLHGFDKNMAYLLSASVIKFGLGDSITSGEYNKDFHGLWKCEVDTKGLSPERVRYVEYITKSQNLLWTQDVEIIKELGAKIKVIEGDCWKYTKRIFEKFYKILASARIEAKIHRLNYEAQIIKDIYTQFFGCMSRKPRSDYGNEFYRPDWDAVIISLTRANIIRNIFKIQENSGDVICGVFRDTLFIASNQNEPIRLPYPLNEIEGKKSPYKHIYSFERSEIFEIIKADSAAQINIELKNLWEQKQIEKRSERLSRIPKLAA